MCWFWFGGSSVIGSGCGSAGRDGRRSSPLGGSLSWRRTHLIVRRISSICCLSGMLTILLAERYRWRSRASFLKLFLQACQLLLQPSQPILYHLESDTRPSKETSCRTRSKQVATVDSVYRSINSASSCCARASVMRGLMSAMVSRADPHCISVSCRQTGRAATNAAANAASPAISC